MLPYSYRIRNGYILVLSWISETITKKFVLIHILAMSTFYSFLIIDVVCELFLFLR